MTTVDRYIEAATRENTRRSYRSAIEHFEVSWGGFLPATADSVARYLADHAETHSLNTLRQRMAALAKWHTEQGFPDPTKTPIVKKVIKGIGEVHPAKEKQARPLQLEQLERIIVWIDQQLQVALLANDRTRLLTQSRNKALVLIGFWRGFRSDELSRISVEHIEVMPGEGMSIFLPRSKTDRLNQGQYFKAPALSRLCPVTAYLDWIANAGLTEGPVFSRIDQWGNVSEKSLHPGSILLLLRELFRSAGIPEPETYSSHSLRRGFASWANANQWDIKTLMEYVGWKDMHSAMRYLDAPDSFSQFRIEQGLATIIPKIDTQPSQITLEVFLTIERFHRRVKGMKKTREEIELLCLKAHKMKALNTAKDTYQIQILHETPEQLDEILGELLHQMHELANENQCMLEVFIKDPESQRIWD